MSHKCRHYPLVYLIPYVVAMFLAISDVRTLAVDRAPNKVAERQSDRKSKDKLSGEQHEHKEVYDHLLHGTAYIQAETADGRTWSGTGWIMDDERQLMITNLHVTGEKAAGPIQSLFAWFPEVKDGEPIHDIQYYVQNIEKIPLTVIYSDSTRDLAIVKLAKLPEGRHAFRLSDKSAHIGERLHSLAGLPQGSSGLFIYTQGTSRAVYKRSIATGTEIQVLETQMPLNRGNSGGPIINDHGAVVGVFEGLMIDPGVQLVNMSIDIQEVKQFLADAEPLIEPKSVADWNRRGDNHYDEGRYDLAFADYSQALKLDPKDAEAISNKGWVYYQKDDLETAKAEFEAALNLKPDFVNALWGRGILRRRSGDYAGALKDFTDAIRNVAGDNDRAHLFNERGDTYYAEKKYDSALSDYDRAVEQDGKNPLFHSNRGYALAMMDRYNDALTALWTAIELDPHNGDYWNLAGNVWYWQERYDNAIPLYGKALEINPQYAVYYRNRGGAYRKAGQANNAIPDLQKAVELAPDRDEYWHELAVAWHDLGRYDLAIDGLNRAIQINDAEAEYYQSRAEAAEHNEDYPSAVQDLTRAIQLVDTAERRALRGNAYRSMGNEEAAKADFRKATELDSSFQLFDRRFLKVVNNSGQKINVYLKYYTKSQNGNWQWYPQNNYVVFTFEPGESGMLYHGEYKVNGNRVRLWADGGESTWYDYRDKDLLIAPEGGYLSGDGTYETYTYSFNP